jgi:hypothetical protein
MYASSSTVNVPNGRAQVYFIGLHIRRMGHNPPRGPSADWWVLTTANVAGTNSLMRVPKQGGIYA